jgi:hypothetical protein
VETATRQRIPRTGKVPPFIREELTLKRQYALQASISNGMGLTTRSRRTRWHWLGDIRGGVQKRSLFSWLYMRKSQIGALEFAEYRPVPLIDNATFFQAMDSDAAFESEMGHVLCSCWDDLATSITDWGTIVEFHMLWMVPTSPTAVWVSATQKILAEHFPKHALLVLKAFPLEYEGSGSSRQGNRWLEIRQKALKRLYAHRLGVVPFPSRFGEEGWMYRMAVESK